ncbi:hypothetical protein AVL50_09390 [Flammeovirga sp. SJP92]|nr:hypothetical protein AVL50_09390 [Flammeovirga sp. SJP92]
MILQTITFYTIAPKTILNQVGKNYISYILEYMDNDEVSIAVVSNLNATSVEIKEEILPFQPYSTDILSLETKGDVMGLLHQGYTLIYLLEFDGSHPFFINTIHEAEAAKEYGAGWESKYIWVLYQWILIEKVNTGIS